MGFEPAFLERDADTRYRSTETFMQIEQRLAALDAGPQDLGSAQGGECSQPANVQLEGLNTVKAVVDGSDQPGLPPGLQLTQEVEREMDRVRANRFQPEFCQ